MGLELNLKEFNALFGEYQQRFIRFAISYISDSVIAEDIVMESFSASWDRRAILTVENFPAYTLTIVKNKCLNHLRAQSVRLKASEDIRSQHSRMLAAQISTLQACDPAELFSAETRRLVDEAVAKLPAKTRDIFISSRFNGKSYKEISDSMGISVKSVEFEVSKAMKILRVALKDYLSALIFLSLLNTN